MEATGYSTAGTRQLHQAWTELLALNEARPGRKSYDLGCGIGEWTLMAAAAGLDSVGIDINPACIDEARRLEQKARAAQLIPASVQCTFLAGSMYPARYDAAYNRFALEHRIDTSTMPIIESEDPYARPGISLMRADIIYSFPWKDQMPFLLSLLAQETKPEAIFVLPHYMDVEVLKATIPKEHHPARFSPYDEWRSILDLASLANSTCFIGRRRDVREHR